MQYAATMQQQLEESWQSQGADYSDGKEDVAMQEEDQSAQK